MRLPILFFLVISLQAQSQDFVKFKDGRMIGGQVAGANARYFRIRNASTGKVEKFDASKVEYYYFGGSSKTYYYLKRVPAEADLFSEADTLTTFIKQEIRGKICVYSREPVANPVPSSPGSNFAAASIRSKPNYFIEGDSTGLRRIDTDLFEKKETKEELRNWIANLFAGNEELKTRFLADKGNTKTVLRYVKEYNAWYEKK